MTETTTIAEPPRKLGPPLNNCNAMTHGAKSAVFRAPVGDLPKRFRKISQYVGRMRRELEAAIIRRHGEITETRALLLQSALRAEQAAKCVQWQLRIADANGALDSKALVALLKLQLDAGKRRDDAIQALDLDSTPADSWKTVFDATPEPPALEDSTEAA